MKCTYSCHSPEHAMARRRFLAGMAATAAGSMVGGLGFFSRPLAAAQLNKDQKRVVVFNMHGGLSQLESWDPKPGTETGGPFRAISTSVPGSRSRSCCRTSPGRCTTSAWCAGVNTSEDDHGKGTYLMITGRRQTPAAEYPTSGPSAPRPWRPRTAPSPATSSSPPAAAAAAATTPPTWAQIREHPPGQRQTAPVHHAARPGQRADGLRPQ